MKKTLPYLLAILVLMMASCEEKQNKNTGNTYLEEYEKAPTWEELLADSIVEKEHVGKECAVICNNFDIATSRLTEVLSPEGLISAKKQYILAIETLCSPSDELADQLARVNDAESYAIAVAEMAYLKALNAGCQFPVASFAEFSDAGTLALRGIYWDESSKRLLRAQVTQPLDARAADSVSQARAAGIALAQKIREQL